MNEFMSYQFQEIRPNKLFLSMATYREFSEEGQASNGTTYYFKENGTVKIEREDFAKGQLEACESKFDVAKNQEDYPDFGNYTKLLAAER